MRFSNLHIVAIILMLIISINSVTFSQNFLKQTDSISNNTIDKYKIYCGNSTSIPIMGSKPNGVDLTVKYYWIKSPDTLNTAFWTQTSPSDTFPNYLAPNLGAIQMFYKRIVIFNGIEDTSNACVVKVLPGSISLSENIVNPKRLPGASSSYIFWFKYYRRFGISIRLFKIRMVKIAGPQFWYRTCCNRRNIF